MNKSHIYIYIFNRKYIFSFAHNHDLFGGIIFSFIFLKWFTLAFFFPTSCYLLRRYRKLDHLYFKVGFKRLSIIGAILKRMFQPWRLIKLWFQFHGLKWNNIIGNVWCLKKKEFQDIVSTFLSYIYRGHGHQVQSPPCPWTSPWTD
jgi:hypothetical protein